MFIEHLGVSQGLGVFWGCFFSLTEMNDLYANGELCPSNQMGS